MAAATTSVVLYSEIPLLKQAEERAHLQALRWILIPHIVAGMVAFLAGPSQFSTQLRRQHLKLHRILGRVYVGSVFVAAPLAIWSTTYGNYPKAVYFKIAIAIQGGTWALTTGIAFVAAVYRRIAMHRDWMVRSYAVTFTFVATRMLQPIPAWNHLGRFKFAMAIICITGLAVLVPRIIRLLRRFTPRPV